MVRPPAESTVSEASPVLTDTTTLVEVLEVVQAEVSIEMAGDFQPESLFEVLLHAASHASSLEQTCEILADAPTGNAVRYHLDKLDDVAGLEVQLNRALAARMPGRLSGTSQRMAIDLNLIPYYGTPSEAETPYIIRSQAKAGTCSFYAYASAYVIARGKRITLALHAVRWDESMVAVLTHLFDRLSSLDIGIKRLYLDRGFYSVPVIRWLQACDIPFLMPVIVRGKQGGTRTLINQKRTYKTTYTMSSQAYGSVSFDVWVVGTYQMGRHGKHGVDYLPFVVYKVPLRLRALPENYRQRFGIECSYRQKNLCRIRTTTKNPATRLLYVGIAFLLVNLWTFMIWAYFSLPRSGGRRLFPELFPLRTLLQFLAQAVERHLGLITQISLPIPPALPSRL